MASMGTIDMGDVYANCTVIVREKRTTRWRRLIGTALIVIGCKVWGVGVRTEIDDEWSPS